MTLFQTFLKSLSKVLHKSCNQFRQKENSFILVNTTEAKEPDSLCLGYFLFSLQLPSPEHVYPVLLSGEQIIKISLMFNSSETATGPQEWQQKRKANIHHW